MTDIITPNIHYRIYVINDFTNVHGCLEYHSYGSGRLESFSSFKTKSLHRGFSKNTDCIEVYLNGKSLGEFKDKASAKSALINLISGCPKECKRDFDTWSWEVLQVIGD